MAKVLMDNIDHKTLWTHIDEIDAGATVGRTDESLIDELHYILKELAIKAADSHTGLTAEDLPPAKKLLDAGHVAYVHLSKDGSHDIQVASA